MCWNDSHNAENNLALNHSKSGAYIQCELAEEQQVRLISALKQSDFFGAVIITSTMYTILQKK